ncbi:hypothetical protein FQN60_010560 [Etheostoma spectabile]|nr:hypothetical protein FQN60_016009 [Etheostoma spectabile]KAA8577409.1 hypothetical protein FQN60_004516 [Etheostoma spectabile]KAA8578242.1 hypothetical protein FQN60_010560 [Etheostoma spectabile]
MNPKHQ